MMKTAKTKSLQEAVKSKKEERKKIQTALKACLSLYDHQWHTGADSKVLESMEQTIETLRVRDSELLSYIASTEHEN